MEAYFFLITRILYFSLSQKIKTENGQNSTHNSNTLITSGFNVLFDTEKQRNRRMDGLVDRQMDGAFYYHTFKGP